jgi:hypothetical protein
LDVGDRQIADSAAECKLWSSKQSSSSSPIPGTSDFEGVAFVPEKRFENMFFGLSRIMGDLGIRDIIVVDR